jgi:hypothetical protein
MTELVAVGALAVAGITWAVRQEGRINTVEKLAEQQFKALQHDIAKLDEKMSDLTDYLLRKDNRRV